MWTTFAAEDGRTLSYQTRGEGPLVICVPGGPGLDPEAYFAPVDFPGFRMVVLAPRGTGLSNSPASPEGWRIGGYVDDLEQLRVHLGLERMTLYGSSHGGSVVLAYACRFSERVERFIVTSAPLRLDDAYQKAADEQERRFVAAVADGASRLAASKEASAQLGAPMDEPTFTRVVRLHFSRYVAEQGPAETAFLDRLCAAPVNAAGVPIMGQELSDPQFSLLAGAERVTAPALVLGGELDVTTPPEHPRETADTLPNAQYVQFAGAGHFPEVEAQALFRKTVSDFLSAGLPLP
ncbi:MAG TPA: alpha/beta hydrolase [Streptosporangiaceae bacterium]|jgi:pimeloyl-ACP methyl ester carboxylesterase|nr:alpha/beta hydrolase [Streptosporangiaceae bacterium]